jgi:uncharacterized protein YbjT (DUF2867 family)
MIVVTTPTGNIGRQVLANLLKSEDKIRVILRNASRLPASLRDSVDVIEGSHGDPKIVERAFAGADAVFWLVPPNPHAEHVDAAYAGFSRPACDAFKALGVKRVVGISALGRGWPKHAGLASASWVMDDLIASSGVAYRALTLPGFMDNALRQRDLIKNKGIFSWPISGDRKMPTCATRDIADVAAKLLLDKTWHGHDSQSVLGPEDLSYNDQAQIMTEVLGKPVRFEPMTLETYRAGLINFGMSEAMAQAVIDLLIAKEEGMDNVEARTAQSTTPTSFRQWCKDVLKPALSI